MQRGAAPTTATKQKQKYIHLGPQQASASMGCVPDALFMLLSCRQCLVFNDEPSGCTVPPVALPCGERTACNVLFSLPAGIYAYKLVNAYTHASMYFYR